MILLQLQVLTCRKVETMIIGTCFSWFHWGGGTGGDGEGRGAGNKKKSNFKTFIFKFLKTVLKNREKHFSIVLR